MEQALIVYDPAKSLELQKVGLGLFKSGLFPNAKNEYGAFAIVQYGSELGLGPMMSLKNINIISGQVACNAQLILTLALQKGVTYEVLEESESGATIKFKRGQAEYTASFTKKDAEAAGLLNKDNWRKYPRDMYFWRAVAKGVRRIAPDAVMGLYTAEEISEGKFVDISTVPTDNNGEYVAETINESEEIQEEVKADKPVTKWHRDMDNYKQIDSALYTLVLTRIGVKDRQGITTQEGKTKTKQVFDLLTNCDLLPMQKSHLVQTHLTDRSQIDYFISNFNDFLQEYTVNE